MYVIRNINTVKVFININIQKSIYYIIIIIIIVIIIIIFYIVYIINI